MANNQGNPQPSTSQANNVGLQRSESSTYAPLTEAELAQLTKELGPKYEEEPGATKIIPNASCSPDQKDKSKLEPPKAEQAPPSPVFPPSKNNPPMAKADAEPKAKSKSKKRVQVVVDDNQCFIARGHSEHEVCIVTENSNSILNSQQSQEGLWGNLNPLDRGDTLERNPLCVNPNMVVNNIKAEQQTPTTNAEFNQQQQHQQQPMYSVTVPVGNQQQINWDDPTNSITFGPEDLHLLQNNDASINVNGPTSTNICVNDYGGRCNFSVVFEPLSASSKNKHWDYSGMLQKLFVDMNKYVLASFNIANVANVGEGLLIRAVPLYATPGFFTVPVKRCPNHAHVDDPSNKEPMWTDKRDHLIRVDNDFAIYDEDPESKRLSVMIPVQPPQAGSATFAVPFKFMCLGSDVGGINRKPVKVIFTLEHGIGNVIGRKSVDVRICSCPKRDKTQEEKREQDSKLKNSTDAGTSSSSSSSATLARSQASLIVNQPPPDKKRRLDTIEEFLLIPVAKRDFESVNKHAEALLISRYPDKIEEIKQQRKRALIKNNPHGTFSAGLPAKPKH